MPQASERLEIVVEYLGPKRNIIEVPPKNCMVYDDRIGRDKKVIAKWQLTKDKRIISQPLPAFFAYKLFVSPHYVEYDPDAQPEIVVVQESLGDAVLQERLTETEKALKESQREIMRLKQNLGKFQDQAAREAFERRMEMDSKEAEKDKFKPKPKVKDNEESQSEVQGRAERVQEAV